MTFVVDASIAAAWYLPDERADATNRLLRRLDSEEAIVPSLFWFEVRSVLLTSVRHRRIGPGDAAALIGQMRRLPIIDAGSLDDRAVLDLALRRAISPYDAAYLALASERQVPLATLDARLAEAARAEGIEVLGPLAGP